MKKSDAVDQMVRAMFFICTQNHPDYVRPGTIELGIQSLIYLLGDKFADEMIKWPMSSDTKKAVETFILGVVDGDRVSIKYETENGRHKNIHVFEENAGEAK